MADENSHSDQPKITDLEFSIVKIPRIIVLSFIRLYQLTLSKTLPSNTCRFYPSCSHYGYQAIYRYGLWKGGFLAIKRILRCNPFNPGGYDPVP